MMVCVSVMFTRQTTSVRVPYFIYVFMLSCASCLPPKRDQESPCQSFKRARLGKVLNRLCNPRTPHDARVHAPGFAAVNPLLFVGQAKVSVCLDQRERLLSERAVYSPLAYSHWWGSTLFWCLRGHFNCAQMTSILQLNTSYSWADLNARNHSNQRRLSNEPL